MSPLTLEVLSGPLDGAEITLTAAADWQRDPGSPLSFPWDVELGKPQAHFAQEEDGSWTLAGCQASHGTYRMHPQPEKIKTPTRLAQGDILRAHQTWLRVKDAP